MKVILVCGFLGSGKTTLIRELATFMVEGRGMRVVILENEAGEVGIDDLFLAGQGFQVKGIFGGCICCQLTGEVTAAVNEIGREFSPDAVVIEATGLARPGPILDVLSRYGEGIKAILTVDVVDAGRWTMLSEMVPSLILGQARESDMILVNKADDCDGLAIEEIASRLAAENPASRVHAVSAARGLDPAILEEIAACRESEATVNAPRREADASLHGGAHDG